jgi:flagellar biosynthesis/type III secretory pathway chaperone
MASDLMESKLEQLEQILVKQFRMLQKLADVTKDERASLLSGAVDQIVAFVEKKEAILDQLSLIEDSRRMVVQELALHYQLQTENLSIANLLPLVGQAQAIPLKRLSEGINSLVLHVRDLTYGNQALATYKIDWMHSLQAFLVAASIPEPGYGPPASGKPAEGSAAFGVDFRA